jgi:hypothetical protein
MAWKAESGSQGHFETNHWESKEYQTSTTVPEETKNPPILFCDQTMITI